MASLEMVTVINLPSVDKPEGKNLTLRGLLPLGFEDARRFEIAAGPLVQRGAA